MTRQWCTLLALVACGGPHDWQARAAIADGPRLEGAVVEAGSLVYLLGGIDADLTIVPTVDAYDPALDEWRPRAPMPAALHHVNAAAVNGKIYVVGALAGWSNIPVGAVYEYDPVLDLWATTRTPMPGGTERGAAAVAVLGQRIVVAGGSADDALDFVSTYDVANDAWAPLPPLPTPRYHAVAQVVGGVVYLVGGMSAGLASGTSTPMTDVVAYDGSWTARAAMPTARGGCASGVIDGRILCAGGEVEPGDAVPAELEAYDPATDAWTELEPMATPRAGTGGAVVNRTLYVPGGARAIVFEPVDTNEAYVAP